MKEKICLLVSLTFSFAIFSIAPIDSVHAAAPVYYTPAPEINWTTWGTLPFTKSPTSFSVQAGDVLVA